MNDFDMDKTASAFYGNPLQALMDGYVPTFMDAGALAADIISFRVLNELIQQVKEIFLHAPAIHFIGLIFVWLIASLVFISHLILFPVCWIYWHVILQRWVKKYNEIKQNKPELIKDRKRYL